MKKLVLATLRAVRGSVKAAIYAAGIGTILTTVVTICAWQFITRQVAEGLPSHAILTIDLNQSPPDQPPGHPLVSALLDAPPTIGEVVEGIRRAEHDDRIQGINLRISGGCCTLAAAQELREALAAYRSVTHRPVLAEIDSFGDGSHAAGAYVVATGADTIQLQRESGWMVTGVRLQVPFLKDAFDTIGVHAEFVHRGNYKSAPETYTNDRPSPAHQEMLDSLTNDIFEQVVAAITMRTGRTTAEIQNLIDHAPLTAEAAKAAGLVDELIDGTGPAVDGSGVKPVAFARYLRAAPPVVKDRTRVALIHLSGEIGDPSTSTKQAGGINPRELTDLLVKASRDDSIKAVVLRIDSPGGSVIGSAMIGAAADQVRAKKPLIASFGSQAASGGYWVAANATRIVADAATLTGSIGVYAGKISFGGLLEKLNVSMGGSQRGTNAGMMSPYEAFGETAVARIDESVGQTYRDFVARTAGGRGLDPQRVEAVAGGRVWTGQQAAAHGLVDVIGGYEAALDETRKVLGLDADSPLEIVGAQTPLNLISALTRAAGGQTAPIGSLGATVLGDVLPPEVLAAVTGLRYMTGLRMMPITIP